MSVANFCGLQAVTKTESELWSTMAATNFDSQMCCPIGRAAVASLVNSANAGILPAVGIVPFSIRGVVPLTPQAHNAGIHSLTEALVWSSNQPIGQETVLHDAMLSFSRVYMRGAIDLAKRSLIGAVVCYGLEPGTARLMQWGGIDRLAVEVLVRNFQIRYSFLGAYESLHDCCRDPVQVALIDWMQAPAKLRTQRRIEYLRKAFRATGSEREQLMLGTDEQNQEIGELLGSCAALGVALPSIQRFAQMCGVKSEDAYNMARRLVRQNHSTRPQPFRARPQTVSLAVQICNSLLVRAIDSSFTPAMVVEAFLWSSLAAVQIARLDCIRGREGYWITWFEKRMHRELSRLVGLSTTIAEKTTSFPQRITKWGGVRNAAD